MTWSYVAGFFDGEGSLRITMGGTGIGSVQVALHQSGERGKEVLHAVGEFLRTHAIGCKQELRRQEGRNRPMYRLYLYGQNALEFLAGVFPHLHVKRVEAQDIVRFRKLYPPVRGNIIFRKSRNRPRTSRVEVLRWL